MTSILLAAALMLSTPEEAVSLLAADAPRPSKEDFEKAKALVETAAANEPTNARWKFGRGLVLLFTGKGLEARSAMGDCAGAVESYSKVLAKQPEARNTRFSMAACLEKLGRKGEAATHYDEFAKRFPKDERAGKAKDQAAKLRKG